MALPHFRYQKGSLVILLVLSCVVGFPSSSPKPSMALLPPSSSSPTSKLKLQTQLQLLSKESNQSSSLPINSSPFILPSPLQTSPTGSGYGFATGNVDLGGGLLVTEITAFNKIWATYEGGPENLGVTIFEPSPIPEGFLSLGFYSQPNNAPLFGSVLVAKDITNQDSAAALKTPIDYSLVWSSQSLNIKQDSPAYIWLPTPPSGYNPVGYVVTTSPAKPPLDAIRCPRSDLTDQCEAHDWIWGSDAVYGVNISSTMPVDNRGLQAMGASVGTFIAQVSGTATALLSCLKNSNSDLSGAMPNVSQVEALIKAYSPWVYFHPEEAYLPSTVSWFFTNGALLYKKGDESNPVAIDADGSNLPQGGTDDGSYWIDLPTDPNAKERVKKGNLETAGAYFHIKPMLGGTFTDIAIWLFYPFNGPARAKVGFIKSVPLGKIGEHVGDWEHVTLRISNFNGGLRSVYFAEHSGGQWVDASALEFTDGNKPVVYSSLHGHASYRQAGTVMLGNGLIGIRDDSGKSSMVMDTGVRHQVISATYLGIVEPPWLNYARKWGPEVSYDIDDEINNVSKLLPGTLKSAFKKFVKSLPAETLGEQGPTGPKMKPSWNGDEK
ncbi:hypothetical protein Dimus_012311 [Dionaea muscipula]